MKQLKSKINERILLSFGINWPPIENSRRILKKQFVYGKSSAVTRVQQDVDGSTS